MNEVSLIDIAVKLRAPLVVSSSGDIFADTAATLHRMDRQIERHKQQVRLWRAELGALRHFRRNVARKVAK